MVSKNWQPDPERDVVLDARTLRALAHPMRTRIVGLLRAHGPQTATGLAQRLGVNSGATSYHLRELAKAGLVVEDESRGNARDRWWRSAYRKTFFQDEALYEREPEAAQTYLRAVAQQYAENMFRAVDELETLPKNWRSAGTLSDYGFHLTPKQLQELLGELEGVLAKYRSEPDAPRPRGARPVAVQIQAFPREAQ
jgi:DNA-binding transcriptional ArsR family regulator